MLLKLLPGVAENFLTIAPGRIAFYYFEQLQNCAMIYLMCVEIPVIDVLLSPQISCVYEISKYFVIMAQSSHP